MITSAEKHLWDMSDDTQKDGNKRSSNSSNMLDAAFDAVNVADRAVKPGDASAEFSNSMPDDLSMNTVVNKVITSVSTLQSSQKWIQMNNKNSVTLN